jgi:cytidine deaminase
MLNENQIDRLVSLAFAARSNAYAPYSKFLVGAAVLMESGEIFTGCNIENSSFGLTICAERTAIAKAVSSGERNVMAVSVATSGGATPCGACRQFISEFADPDAVVIVLDVDRDDGERVYSLAQLLPHGFRLTGESES